VIPFIYRLRNEVRIENRGDVCLVISETPLNVIRVRARVAQILRLCDGRRTLGDVAAQSGVPEEEQVFRICEYFNKRGVLEILATQNDGYFPTVTVIIPARDRRDELVECLESVFSRTIRRSEWTSSSSTMDPRTVPAGRRPCSPAGFLRTRRAAASLIAETSVPGKLKGRSLPFSTATVSPGVTGLKELVTYFRWERVGRWRTCGWLLRGIGSGPV